MEKQEEWCDHCVRFCIPRRELHDLYQTSSCSFCGKILSDKTTRRSAIEYARKKRGMKVSTKEEKHYSMEEEEENALGCKLSESVQCYRGMNNVRRWCVRTPRIGQDAARTGERQKGLVRPVGCSLGQAF
ncbi:uncharacterized protein G2W53_029414 [Senna tora]|uniref:Uncharacterized protein n=1 Tax=Senna tora TaxID=362788 RepID=A0A834T5I8_9FABA|nr:uncharacterized protein G2W53_029414 [Senna tora]